MLCAQQMYKGDSSQLAKLKLCMAKLQNSLNVSFLFVPAKTSVVHAVQQQLEKEWLK